ncbi:hypothetical protein CK203_027122 [Vitis vinifera]|uniref:Uncharacterized protein n=1 Tax=Vitis vinifera TaxID=29760 RepID=A0A438I6C5_VITVI|nr:hypothetical protein CK203_027122 [Vitis vinifera]
MGSRSPEEFSVLVLASDLGIDARPFLDAQAQIEEQDENWHDCSQYLSDEDFSDLDLLQFIRIQGSDKSGNRILRIVGKYLPVSLGLKGLGIPITSIPSIVSLMVEAALGTRKFEVLYTGFKGGH